MHALSRDDDSVFVERQAYSTAFSQCMGVYVENNVLPYILKYALSRDAWFSLMFVFPF